MSLDIPADLQLSAQSGDADAQLALARLFDLNGRHDDALDQLRGAARAGRGEAMSELGDRLLVGRDAPFAPQEGVALVRDAAERGDLSAVNRLATLTAAGAWTPQSWAGAFDLLVAAAEGGQPQAQAQLVMLAQDDELAARARAGEATPSDWRRLADSFRLEAWTADPGRRVLCDRPRIRVVERFITPEICAWLIGRAQGRLHPGLMYNGRESVVMPTRNCSEYTFDIVQSDVVSLLVRVKIAAATKLPVTAMEPTQIFHYGVGQEIRAHYDLVRDTPGEGSRAASSSAGERIATVLIYLNDDYDGGELHFTLADVTFRGRAGDAIYFANVDEAGKAERMSLHLALPVTRGEKWMASQWIQDRPTYPG